MQEPLGIDIVDPRLSWQLQDSTRGARQTAYEVRVASTADALAQNHADVWDSGQVNSDESVNVVYGGPAAESRRRYYWQVRTWDAQGQASSYSQPSWWEMGLLSSSGLESEMDYSRHASGAWRLRVGTQVDLGCGRQRADQCDAGETLFPFPVLI